MPKDKKDLIGYLEPLDFSSRNFWIVILVYSKQSEYQL